MESWKKESFTRAAEKDLETWSSVMVLREEAPAEYHRRMMRVWETHPNALIVAPPGSRKSTYLVEDWSCFNLCRNPDWTGLIVRATLDRGQEQMDPIRSTLKSKLIEKFYGRVIAEGFDTKKGLKRHGRRRNDANPSLKVVGLDGDWSGLHVGNLMWDDVAIRDNQKSADAIAALVDLLEHMTQRLRNTGRGVRWVNNFICPNDAPQQMMREGFFRGCHWVFPAELTNGKSACPLLWPDEPGLLNGDGELKATLAELRDQLGARKYRLFMLCQPIGTGDRSIPDDAFRFWAHSGKCEPGDLELTDELRAKLHIRYGLDPGGGGKTVSERRSAWFGLVKLGVNPDNGVHYVLRHAMYKGGVKDHCDVVQAWFEDEPGLVVCERNNIGAAYYQELRDRDIPSRDPHVDFDHATRIEHIRLRMEKGRMLLYHEEPNDRYPTLERQLRNAPYGLPRDGADGLFHAMEPVRSRVALGAVVVNPHDAAALEELRQLEPSLDVDALPEMPEEPAEWHELAEAPQW
jgi:hypothetical protein